MHHIGTQQVNLTPMSRLEYNDFRGWCMPDDENGQDVGYLIESIDTNPNLSTHKGYVSWITKDQADAMYNPVTSMSFGDAIILLKDGYRVARTGWNGSKMSLLLVDGSNKLASAMGYGFGEYLGEPTFRDAIFMITANNELVPWTCAQSDILANDWTVVI